MFAPDFVYRISLPQKIKSSFYVPDENEIKVIYKLIKNTELEIPFLLASQCGLRPSEICALTKDCITADGLEIRKAVVIMSMAEKYISRLSHTPDIGQYQYRPYCEINS